MSSIFYIMESIGDGLGGSGGSSPQLPTNCGQLAAWGIQGGGRWRGNLPKHPKREKGHSSGKTEGMVEGMIRASIGAGIGW